MLSRAFVAPALVTFGLAAGGCSPAGQSASPSTTPASVASAAVAPPASDTPPPASDAASAVAEDGPGWLGVEVGIAPPGQAGVLVESVMHGSPAESAGLRAGDRILRIGHEDVANGRDVVRIVSSHRGGDRLGLSLTRDGEERLMPVVLAARPDPDEMLKLELGGDVAPAWRPLATGRGSVPQALAGPRGRGVVMGVWASWGLPCRMARPPVHARARR